AIDMQCAGNAGCIAVLLCEPLSPLEHAREFAEFAPQLCFTDEAALFRGLQDLRRDGPPPMS
ncbi:MAG: hypothetical protein ACREFQ_11690, partial [Stellaceae bacterium]